MNKKLHIISFDVPYPPNYGGVIDVFHKVQALAACHVEIYLHMFQYGRQKQSKLNSYCKEVHYYNRNTSALNALGLMPYIVKSRKSSDLNTNLKKIEAPILLEGLHTTFILKAKLFSDRRILVRAHNIEHLYYQHLANTEGNIFKKLYYWSGSRKLKRYEKVLKGADKILPLSMKESEYFKKKYSEEKVTFLPAFHASNGFHELSKKGYFAFFHGNLNVTDNVNTVLLLIDIFKPLDYPLVIAGNTSDKKLLSKIDHYKNISFIELKDEDQLFELLHRAHVNILFSKNKAGLKLKLINSVFQSRYVIANNNVAEGSGLEPLVKIANTKKEITHQLLQLIDKDFSEEEIAKRYDLLKLYDNQNNARLLMEELYS
ncbi:hypothetical protein [Lutimonas sp.]|uniref:hypothetical protein n=1 Tax=Lutimonas sp. TaxID=1872403 RepID=UPI003D9ADF20